MPNLKDLKNRINSVKSTQKITKAMQMVASSKLRRAQENAEAARPYTERMEGMLRAIAESVAGNDNAPAMLAGSGASDTHLLLVTTSDRGRQHERPSRSSTRSDTRWPATGLLPWWCAGIDLIEFHSITRDRLTDGPGHHCANPMRQEPG